MLKCGYGWPCYEGPVVCEDHKPRETPLLVDALAERLKQLIEITETLLMDVWPGPEKGAKLAAIEAAKAILAQYEEEVGGADTE